MATPTPVVNVATPSPKHTFTESDEQLTTFSDLPGPSTSLSLNKTTGRTGAVSCLEDQKYTNIGSLLHKHSSKILGQSSEYIISIDRSTPEHFWLAVTSFYKGAIVKPDKLRRPLVVNYVNTGESGCDSGALRKEFFEDAIQEANDRLFEGEDNRRVPKKDVSLELVFEMAGMLFGHSIIQEGPGLPCLSPAVFDYLTHGDVRLCYPTKEDIPLNISTHELITLIEEVCRTLYI